MEVIIIVSLTLRNWATMNSMISKKEKNICLGESDISKKIVEIKTVACFQTAYLWGEIVRRPASNMPTTTSCKWKVWGFFNLDNNIHNFFLYVSVPTNPDNASKYVSCHFMLMGLENAMLQIVRFSPDPECVTCKLKLMRCCLQVFTSKSCRA